MCRSVFLLLFVVACSNGGPGSRGGDAGVGPGHLGGDDGGGLPDLRTAPPDLSTPPDGKVAADLASGGGLDPGLALPAASGLPCVTPGALSECPNVQVCRPISATEGRCESCTNCGNLHALCSASAECDILFDCYLGRCQNFCTLGTSECGPPTACADVGAGARGVCKN